MFENMLDTRQPQSWINKSQSTLNRLNCGNTLRAKLATTELETINVNAASVSTDHKNNLDWATGNGSLSDAAKSLNLIYKIKHERRSTTIISENILYSIV